MKSKTSHSSEAISQALFRSLVSGPLLLGHLPEGAVFPLDSLVLPEAGTALNLEQKLGHLYEDALAVILASTSRYESVERGLQICAEGGTTLGELDFLIRDLSSGQLIHLELAVKFYLAVETANGCLLPGPDARDNYFRKLEKMRSHQLVLTAKYREFLPEPLREKAIIVQQLVQGCLFEHVHARQSVEVEHLNPMGRRGKWLHAKDCQAYFGDSARLEHIPKPLWPVPLEILADFELSPWVPDAEMDRCVMVRLHTGAYPYFIVPDGYPMGLLEG